MRHHDSKRKFGRERNVRRALIKSLASSLIIKRKIKTTDAKARELRPYIEKMVTKAKRGDLSSKRMIISKIGTKKAAKILFDDIAPNYKERPGGYTRIVKLPRRTGDGSKMAIIEFV